TFLTHEIPFGMTYTDLPESDSSGYPIIPTLPDDRNKEIIDPHTGATLRRVSLPGDSKTGPFMFFGGAPRVSEAQSRGHDNGYLCAFPTQKGGSGSLYYIIPSTGESRFLGSLSNIPYPSLDPVDGKIYICTIDAKVPCKSITRGTYSGSFLAA